MDNRRTSLVAKIAEEGDLSVLAHFLSLIDGQPIGRGEIAARLEALAGRELPILAWANGAAVGLAGLRISACLSSAHPCADLTELFVLPENVPGPGSLAPASAVESEAIEAALLEEAERLANSRGAAQITLLTGLRNHAVQGRYRMLGYREYALAMRKLLSRPVFDR